MSSKRTRRVASAEGGGSALRLKYVLLPLIILIGGLALAIASGVHHWHMADRADRLRVDGVAVTARVTDRTGGDVRGAGVDRIEIYYLYAGAQYHTWIPCAGATGCHGPAPKELTIWVDPEAPEHFVAENGNVDGSLSFLASWGTIAMGLAFAAIGGTGSFFLLFGDHLFRRSQQRQGGNKTRSTQLARLSEEDDMAARRGQREGWRPPGWNNPRAYALSVSGGLCVLVGVVFVNSIALAAIGVGLALAGWLLARRSA